MPASPGDAEKQEVRTIGMRTVLITGGSGGMGTAMVRRFAAAGDQVYFTWKDSREAAEMLAAETGAVALQADARVPEDMEAAVERPIQDYGRLDVLICNAGISLNRMLMDTTDDEFHRVMDTNVYGTFSVARAAVRQMFWQHHGVIVTVSSIWGQTGSSCEAVYSASKAAVIGLTRALAKEVARAGIRVNCIAPGIIDTRMNGMLSEKEKEEISEEIPLGRIGTAEETAEAAFFLAGEGSSYITGQVIGVNGGWLI